MSDSAPAPKKRGRPKKDAANKQTTSVKAVNQKQAEDENDGELTRSLIRHANDFFVLKWERGEVGCVEPLPENLAPDNSLLNVPDVYSFPFTSGLSVFANYNGTLYKADIVQIFHEKDSAMALVKKLELTGKAAKKKIDIDQTALQKKDAGTRQAMKNHLTGSRSPRKKQAKKDCGTPSDTILFSGDENVSRDSTAALEASRSVVQTMAPVPKGFQISSRAPLRKTINRTMSSTEEDLTPATSSVLSRYPALKTTSSLANSPNRSASEQLTSDSEDDYAKPNKHSRVSQETALSGQSTMAKDGRKVDRATKALLYPYEIAAVDGQKRALLIPGYTRLKVYIDQPVLDYLVGHKSSTIGRDVGKILDALLGSDDGIRKLQMKQQEVLAVRVAQSPKKIPRAGMMAILDTRLVEVINMHLDKVGHKSFAGEQVSHAMNDWKLAQFKKYGLTDSAVENK